MKGRGAQVAWAAALFTGAVARVWLARADDGVFWPDEIFQSLEPAHRLVYGYGLIAWEFLEGARHWTLPGLVAGLLWAARVLGLSEPEGYLFVVRTAFAAVGVLTAAGVFFLARSAGAAAWPSAAGSALFSLLSMAVYFAPRAMGETVAACFVVFGLALGLPKAAGRGRLAAAASLLAVAVFFRLQAGLFPVAFLALLFARKKFREAGFVFAVLLGWALLFGAVDRLTWGGWFHSAVAYLRFNLFEGRSSEFGRQPFFYYVRVLWTSVGPVALAWAVLGAIAWRRSGWLWGTAVLFVLVHSFVPHKEVRFLFPAVPLLCAASGVGVDEFGRRFGARALRLGLWLLFALALHSLAGLRGLTFGRLGLYERPPGRLGAIDAGGPENRLLMRASRQADLCGIRVLTRELWKTGGSSYLHRAVPLYPPGGPPVESGRYNYLVAERGHGAGEEVADDGPVALFRLGPGPCNADPNYDWHLD